MAALPLGMFVRFAIATGLSVFQNWDTISAQFDSHRETGDIPLFGYYLQNVFEMKDGSGTFTPRERGMWGIHYVNTTAGELDATWTTSDFAAVESATQTMWTALQTWMGSDVRIVEHRWYSFGPRIGTPNPPTRVTTLGTPLVGTSTPGSIRQVASSITLRTALRRHWGRFYLPIASSQFNTFGQFSSTQATNLANAAATCMKSPATSNGILPVVWDRQRKVALGVTAVEADTVPDIIRRRRPRTATAKAIVVS